MKREVQRASRSGEVLVAFAVCAGMLIGGIGGAAVLKWWPRADRVVSPVTGGTGLTGGGTSGPTTIGLATTCAEGETLANDGAAWFCRPSTFTTLEAHHNCAPGTVYEYQGDDVWQCVRPEDFTASDQLRLLAEDIKAMYAH